MLMQISRYIGVALTLMWKHGLEIQILVSSCFGSFISLCFPVL